MHTRLLLPNLLLGPLWSPQANDVGFLRALHLNDDDIDFALIQGCVHSYRPDIQDLVLIDTNDHSLHLDTDITIPK
jgi:hypothetical protein